MSELPKGWRILELKNLGEYINGRAFKPSEWGKKGLPIVRIQNLTGSSDHYNYSYYTHEDKYLIKNGELLVAWSASLGAFIWKGNDAWLNQHIFKVIPNKQLVTKRFLYYTISNAIEELYHKSHGTGMVHVTKPVFESHKVCLPSLPEQKRIVEKLDKLLAKVEESKARLVKIPGILKRFRQSVMNAAVTGELTKDWRKNNQCNISENMIEEMRNERIAFCTTDKERQAIRQNFSFEADELKGWIKIKANFISDFITKGTTPKYLTSFGEIPYLKVYNIVDDNIDFHYKPQYTSFEIHNNFLRRSIVYPGDVLLNIVGPPLGKVALVPGQYTEWNINQALARFRPIKSVLAKFLYYILKDGYPLNQILLDTKGIVGQSNISLEQCRNLKLEIPSTLEQQEIIKRVETLFKKADEIEERYKEAKCHIDKITQSILAKAFRGELVQQDSGGQPTYGFVSE